MDAPLSVLVHRDCGQELLQVRDKLALLKLSNQAVIDREHRREAEFGRIQSPWFIRFPFAVLCWTLDVVYNNRPIQRCTAPCFPQGCTPWGCPALCKLGQP